MLEDGRKRKNVSDEERNIVEERDGGEGRSRMRDEGPRRCGCGEKRERKEMYIS